MQTGENEQALRKILDMTRLMGIAVSSHPFLLLLLRFLQAVESRSGFCLQDTGEYSSYWASGQLS